MFCDFIVFCFCVVFLLARICVEFAVFLGRFLALGSFRLKMASNPFTFHLFFRVLRFSLFSVIFVSFFFRRFFR